MHILVFGDGLIGRSTALRLAKEGHRVEVWARRPAEAETSSVAAAFWTPFKGGESTRKYALATFAYLSRLGLEDGVESVLIRSFFDARSRQEHNSYWWLLEPAFASEAKTLAVPSPFRVNGVELVAEARYRAPRVSMNRLLEYICVAAKAAGVEFKYGVEVKSRAGVEVRLAKSGADRAVLCLGLLKGIRKLDTDPRQTTYWQGGRLIRIRDGEKRSIRLDEVRLAGEGYFAMRPIYTVPIDEGVIIGGSAEDSTAEPLERIGWKAYDEDVDGKFAQYVFPRALELEERLEALGIDPDRAAEELTNAVRCRRFRVDLGFGRRPIRSMVRVGRDDVDSRIFFNYGHGGSGVTLFWGTAGEVCRIME